MVVTNFLSAGCLGNLFVRLFFLLLILVHPLLISSTRAPELLAMSYAATFERGATLALIEAENVTICCHRKDRCIALETGLCDCKWYFWVSPIELTLFHLLSINLKIFFWGFLKPPNNCPPTLEAQSKFFVGPG